MRATLRLLPGETSPTDTDGHLVELSREGDADAFSRLYARYHRQVLSACTRQLRDAALAEDVTHDTFLIAYTHLGRFDTTRRMLPWLLAIAVRRCIDVQRRGSRIAVREVSDRDLDGDGGSRDETADSAFAAQDRRDLERALAKLPWRQRRALLLFALEGWTYAQIASVEGTSVIATKSLLWRARENLKQLYRPGTALGILLVALGRLRRSKELSVSTVRGHQLTFAAQAVASLMLLISVSVSPTLTPTVAPLLQSVERTRPEVARPLDGAATNAANAPGGTEEGTTSSVLLEGLRRLTPEQEATPETTKFSSFVFSPNFDDDRTIYAAGVAKPCLKGTCAVLFVSHDAGASWRKLAASGFTGTTVMLPPAYPQDHRIFAMGPGGLTASANGGGTFTSLVPIEGVSAIAPSNDAGHPHILITGVAVTDYWAGNPGVLGPASLAPILGPSSSVAFSSGFARDGITLVGGQRINESLLPNPAVYRCVEHRCEAFDLPRSVPGEPQVQLSPGFERDGVAGASLPGALYRSRDGGRSFQAVALPEGHLVEWFAIMPGGGMLLATYVPSGGGGVFLESHAGRGWTATTPIAYPGFEDGVRLVVQHDSTILVAGHRRGIACSQDRGRTWTERCRPPAGT